ncbi:Fructosamine kinase-domain-containing protein [Xylaria cf. heliscus]|nr:Fructosamine kinase-domain-containing protein [Xylaria cf. heliscus]
MPKGCQVVSISPCSNRNWSSGLKVITRPHHLEMARGEFESQKEPQKYLPDNVVTPLAYDKLELDTSSLFSLNPFPEVFRKLYQTSISPIGKFGFYCNTMEGYFSRYVREPNPELYEVAKQFFERTKLDLLDTTTRCVILYNLCCYYGHNEFDLAMMREPHYQLTNEHAAKYRELVPPSEPAEEFDVLNAMHAINRILEVMRKLMKKYTDGINRYEE